MLKFDSVRYLSRIGITERLKANIETLHHVHRSHVFNVPFENLDIHFKNRFTLHLPSIYKKVVLKRRGGFCYELNLLFCELLRSLGFSVKLISAQIVNEDGSVGPPYDHLCLHVVSNGSFLADVGYGDLFLTPIEITGAVQFDGRNYFKIEDSKQGKCLLMSSDGKDFQKKYIFNLESVTPEHFDAICVEKQTHPNSYFVKNTVCTKPTATGRITLFNNKIIERTADKKLETEVLNDRDLKMHLEKYFDIIIPKTNS